jgi:hypothetical protein
VLGRTAIPTKVCVGIEDFPASSAVHEFTLVKFLASRRG